MLFGRATRRSQQSDAAEPSSRNLLRRVNRMQLRCASLIDGHLVGGYDSIFKGEGIEFDETRPYQPGDDVRAIDWRVTARFSRPFVKRFRQQRQLTVHVLVDGSASMRMPGTESVHAAESVRAAELVPGAEPIHGDFRTPLDVAREICGVLIMIAARQQDQTGLTLFTDRLEHMVEPLSGDNHAARLIGDLVRWKPQGRRTDLSPPVDRLQRLARHRSLVVIASDFLSLQDSRQLRALTGLHEVVPVWVSHSTNAAISPCGLLRVQDPETRQVRWLDTNSRRQRASFHAAAAAHRQRVEKIFSGLGVLPLRVDCQDEVVPCLHRYFDRRGQLA